MPAMSLANAVSFTEITCQHSTYFTKLLVKLFLVVLIHLSLTNEPYCLTCHFPHGERWVIPERAFVFGKVCRGSMPRRTFGVDGIKPSLTLFSALAKILLILHPYKIYPCFFFHKFLPGFSFLYTSMGRFMPMLM